MHNQLIVLIIFGAIAFINYLIRQSASTSRRPGSGPRPSNLPPPQRQSQTTQAGDDERLHKFMEALGVPSQAPPPSKIPPQPPYAPRAQAPVRRQTPTPLPRQVAARKVYTPHAPAPSAYQTETMTAQTPAATGYDVATSTSGAATPVASTVAPATSTAADLKSLLRSPSSMRVAMVLKEILGPPRALQTGEITGGSITGAMPR